MFEKLSAENLPVAFASIHYGKESPLSEQKTTVEKFFKEKKINVPNYFDVDGKILKDYDIENFPTTIVIDTHGIIRYMNVGSHPKAEEIFEAQIKSLLGNDGGGAAVKKASL